jgi:hypothetical protein
MKSVKQVTKWLEDRNIFSRKRKSKKQRVLEWLYREIQQRKHGTVDRVICRIYKLNERFKRNLKLKVSAGKPKRCKVINKLAQHQIFNSP